MLSINFKSSINGVTKEIADHGGVDTAASRVWTCSQRSLVKVNLMAWVRKVVVTKRAEMSQNKMTPTNIFTFK